MVGGACYAKFEKKRRKKVKNYASSVLLFKTYFWSEKKIINGKIIIMVLKYIYENKTKIKKAETKTSSLKRVMSHKSK